jgi:hypothetical protein
MTDMRHVIAALLGLFASTALAQFETKKIEIPDWENAVRFEVVASQAPVRPGDAFELAVVAEIEPGYHLYGPEEPEPTRTEVRVQPGVLEPGPTMYPPVIHRELEGLGAYNLYEGSIAVRIPVTLPPNFQGKTWTLASRSVTSSAPILPAARPRRRPFRRPSAREHPARKSRSFIRTFSRRRSRRRSVGGLNLK